jgi:hypothetical protein
VADHREPLPPGPVKRWADMTEAERAKVRATAKPPAPAPILPAPDFICSGRAPTEGAPVEVVCTRKIRETEKAALYLVADLGEEKWIPKSVIQDSDEMDDGSVVLTLARWFAVKAELIDA